MPAMGGYLFSAIHTDSTHTFLLCEDDIHCNTANFTELLGNMIVRKQLL